MIAAHPTVLAVGWAVLHSVWQGTVVAGVLKAVLLLLRDRSSNTRYVAACVALALMALCPIATFSLLHAGPSNAVQPGYVSVEALAPGPVPLLAHGHAPEVMEHWRDVISSHPFGPLTHLLEPAIPWLTLGWIVGVLALSARLLGCWVWMENLGRKYSKPLGGPWQGRLDALARQLHLPRRVRLLQSSGIDIPITFGFIRPAVLVPVSALLGLTQEQLEAVLAHELAHVRRGDWLARLLQTLAENLLFYHPAAWWVSRRITIEREFCCDDLASAVCADSFRYAEALAELARIRVHPLKLALAADDGSLLARIQRILYRSPIRESRYGKWWPGGILAVATVVLLAVTIHWNASVGRLTEPQTAGMPASISSDSLRAPRKELRTPPEGDAGIILEPVLESQKENTSLAYHLLDEVLQSARPGAPDERGPNSSGRLSAEDHIASSNYGLPVIAVDIAGSGPVEGRADTTVVQWLEQAFTEMGFQIRAHQLLNPLSPNPSEKPWAEETDSAPPADFFVLIEEAASSKTGVDGLAICHLDLTLKAFEPAEEAPLLELALPMISAASTFEQAKEEAARAAVVQGALEIAPQLLRYWVAKIERTPAPPPQTAEDPVNPKLAG